MRHVGGPDDAACGKGTIFESFDTFFGRGETSTDELPKEQTQSTRNSYQSAELIQYDAISCFHVPTDARLSLFGHSILLLRQPHAHACAFTSR